MARLYSRCPDCGHEGVCTAGPLKGVCVDCQVVADLEHFKATGEHTGAALRQTSAAGTRDDLAAVVQALTDSAAEQRRWQQEYEAKAVEWRGIPSSQAMYQRFAAQARGTAVGYEVSVDMLNKYVQVAQ